MKIARYTILAAAIIGIFLSEHAFSQVTGDYRSIATGNWSAPSTWETFDGANWVAAANAPAGTETITVRGVDTVRVDVAVSIAGYVKVEATGGIEVTAGSLTFGNGSTYEHARDAGSVPLATWAMGSTFLLTGTVQDAPANRNQNFYNVTFDTPNLGRNRDMGWDNITIGGNVRVISTGANRWQMSSIAANDTAAFTIMGDVIVEAGQFAVQGTGTGLTTFIVNHYGNINVTGGNFSLARGSQGSGSGTTTWNLYEGNFSMSNATTQNSNPTAGNAKLVFAKNGTQQLTFNNVTYGGGRLHFEVASTSALQITQDFIANGNFVNRGAIEPMGTLTFANGAVYEHARDAGAVPTATWETGSTALFSGITSTAPDNRGQDYYNLVLNTPGLSSNRDLSLNGHTIGGDITVVSTGATNRWQLVGGSSGTVTIMGDVIVQAGQLAAQGTSSATDVVIDHYGNINVTGGNFSISRGSQGNGTGTTTWNLHKGNFSMSNATTQNSNPTAGNAKFVFAQKDTQQLAFENVAYGGGRIHFEVSDSTALQITKDFTANGNLVNHGAIATVGTLTFADGAVYEHARDGGDVPTAVWETGSTALFTGITGTAPNNRGQDYYNLTLNTPGLSSNRDLALNGHTIGGDITVISTGATNRWQLVGGSSGTVTIMGDVIVQDGQLATQGTSSATAVVIEHHGNINVTGGNFSISRGSQSNGTGTTTWNLHKGNFSMANATTQNSNPTAGNAKFVFANTEGAQQLTLVNVTYGGGGLPIQVDSAATLNMDTTAVGGNGIFNLNAGATLASGHRNGIDGNLQTSGAITLSKKGNFTYNGIIAQVPGFLLLPDSIGVLTVANKAGVAFNDTLRIAELVVADSAVMKIDTLGSVTADSGAVNGAVVNHGVLASTEPLVFGGESTYEHARDGGSIPSGVWNEGSTALLTGITGTAPENRNQNYYNLTFNTPGLGSNLHMNLNRNTIGGDIRVINTGSTNRWYLTSASADSTAMVTIMGDVIVEAGALSVQGTSNARTTFIVHHYGNVVVTGGNFSVARGSQGSGTGSTRWYLHEGNLSIANATTQNSNPTNAWFVFDNDGVQTLTLSSVTYGGGGLAIKVDSSSTLDFGGSELGGNGLFTLNKGAILATAHANGIAGAVQTTGSVTFDPEASYMFNGTAAQITSTLMPTTLNGLAINNEAGVVLSQPTTINGVLRLMAGELDNTIPFTLGPNGSISYEGGRLKFTTAVDEQSPEIPTEFALFQNYPNPFNPSTTIHYDLPKRTHVTLKIYDVMGHLVAELVNGEQDAGAYNVVWDAQGLTSGVYYYKISAEDFTSVRKLVLIK